VRLAGDADAVAVGAAGVAVALAGVAFELLEELRRRRAAKKRKHSAVS
jgi:hypothetical protein